MKRGGYIDRYSPKLFVVLVIILGLNILDVILTMVILEHQGYELNPVVRSAIDVYGDRFWMWKYGIISACILLLCLHIKFKRVKTIIVATCSRSKNTSVCVVRLMVSQYRMGWECQYRLSM